MSGRSSPRVGALALGCAVLTVVLCAAGPAVAAGGPGQRPVPTRPGRPAPDPDFWFGPPRGSIRVHTNRLFARQGSDLYDFLRDEMFWAEKGAGAYVNDHRLRVSERKLLADALLATGLPFKGHESHPAYFDQLGAVMSRVAGVRRMGSASLDLAYVAAGRYEAFWEYGLQPWDVAAGILLVREAGGFVSEIEGDGDPYESGNVLAANAHLHGPVHKLLRGALEAPD